MNRRHELISAIRAERKSAGADVSGRHVRSRWTLSAFASIVSLGLVLVTLMPQFASQPAVGVAEPTAREAPQTFTATGDHSHVVSRDAYSVEQIVVEPVAPVAPAAGIPDPGSAQAIAYDMVMARGWNADEYSCLVALWNRESGWNVYAHNSSSGAYGIPQALPGEKMASAGADWATNPVTQITWGLGYIANRYGTPCGAWGHSEERGWY